MHPEFETIELNLCCPVHLIILFYPLNKNALKELYEGSLLKTLFK